MSKVTMPEPVAWRSRYCSPQGMIGHYPWSYVEHSLRQPILNNYDIESLITTDQAEAYKDACVRAAMGWQPIETAPKDGTAVLVANKNGAWIAKYDPVYQSGYRAENPWFSLMLNHDHVRKGKPYAPTHWMPLPPPPQDDNE